MRALTLKSIDHMEMVELPMPTPQAGWATIRVSACGVCGSDIPRVFTKGTYHFPTVIGHEFSGIIEHIEPNDNGFAVGDRVSVFPLIPCGKCEMCGVGEYHLCSDYDYLGSRRDGAFAEYVCAPISNLLKLPDGVDIDHAAMVEPCAVALHAVRRGRIDAGDTVWVAGAGPIGMLIAKWAKILGASRVMISDIDQAKLDLAAQWVGAEPINSSKCDPIEQVMQLTNNRGVDLAIEAVGIAVTANQALKVARKHGRVVFMGNPAGDVNFPQKVYWEILRRELTIVGGWNSSYGSFPTNEWKVVLDAMADGRLDVSPLITHRVSLEQAYQTMQAMRDRKIDYIKVLVKP